MRWIYRILYCTYLPTCSTSTFVSVASNRRKAKSKKKRNTEEKCVCACFMPHYCSETLFYERGSMWKLGMWHQVSRRDEVLSRVRLRKGGKRDIWARMLWLRTGRANDELIIIVYSGDTNLDRLSRSRCNKVSMLHAGSN